jgi:hypothetical protein
MMKKSKQILFFWIKKNCFSSIFFQKNQIFSPEFFKKVPAKIRFHHRKYFYKKLKIFKIKYILFFYIKVK